MNKCIMSESNAVSFCLTYLQEKLNYKWSNLIYLNKDRYCIALGRDGNPTVAILLKKAWFEKFGDMGFINETTGLAERGIGDSINVSNLKEFIGHNVKTIYIVHSSGAIYSIDLMSFLVNSHRREIKESSEEVRSISIHYYSRVNKERGMA